MSGGFRGSNGPGTTDGTGVAASIGRARRVQRDSRPEETEPEPVVPDKDVPTGAMTMFGGTAAPDGYFMCDGSALDRTEEAALFAVIGTTYGVGSGSNSFSLPDFRGAFPVAPGANGFNGLGQEGGTTTHSHDLNGLRAGAQLEVTDAGSLFAITRTAPTGPWTPNTRVNGEANAAMSQRTRSVDLTGRTETTTAIPPYLVVNFIIKG